MGPVAPLHQRSRGAEGLERPRLYLLPCQGSAGRRKLPKRKVAIDSVLLRACQPCPVRSQTPPAAARACDEERGLRRLHIRRRGHDQGRTANDFRDPEAANCNAGRRLREPPLLQLAHRRREGPMLLCARLVSSGREVPQHVRQQSSRNPPIYRRQHGAVSRAPRERNSQRGRSPRSKCVDNRHPSNLQGASGGSLHDPTPHSSVERKADDPKSRHVAGTGLFIDEAHNEVRAAVLTDRVVNNQAEPSLGLWLGLSLQSSVFRDRAWIELGGVLFLCTKDRPIVLDYIALRSQSQSWYNESKSASIVAKLDLRLGPKLASRHRRTHCIAAKSWGDIARRLGSNRSPSSLKMLSQSQLEAGIEITSIASWESWG
jgi:hypothetical protein